MSTKKHLKSISGLKFTLILIVLCLINVTDGYSQFQGNNDIDNALIRLVEPGQLADTVNVWGDIGQSGRYLVPRNMTVAQLMSFAGGPNSLSLNSGSGVATAFAKSRIKVTLSRFDEQSQREVARYFQFKFSEKIPSAFRTYDLNNEEIIIIEVERKPTFLDYLGVIGPILGTITTSYFIYDQIIR